MSNVVFRNWFRSKIRLTGISGAKFVLQVLRCGDTQIFWRRLFEQQFFTSRHVRGCRSKIRTKFAVVPQFVLLPVFQFTSRPWLQEQNPYKIRSSPSICCGHGRQQCFGKTESIISSLQKFDNLSRPYEICRNRTEHSELSRPSAM